MTPTEQEFLARVRQEVGRMVMTERRMAKVMRLNLAICIIQVVVLFAFATATWANIAQWYETTVTNLHPKH